LQRIGTYPSGPGLNLAVAGYPHGVPTETARLRRSRTDAPGIRRRRAGRGFAYLDELGAPLRDEAALARIAALAIPPAWQQVWICPAPQCHIYAQDNGSYGLATLERRHARVRRGAEVQFDYIAKSGIHRVESVADADVAAVVAALKRRRDPDPTLFAYRSSAGWASVRSAQINAHLRESFGLDVSAKDFRTWHATVLMAAQLAAAAPAASARARDRTVSAGVRVVAQALGNTPAVCRASYIDPRVIDAYHHGEVIALPRGGAAPPEAGLDARADAALQRRIERAVLDLLG
jgi:DNA topoisomerase IB